jgi:hypothetical protein
MRDGESAMNRLRRTTILSLVPSLIALTGCETSSLTRFDPILAASARLTLLVIVPHGVV